MLHPFPTWIWQQIVYILVAATWCTRMLIMLPPSFMRACQALCLARSPLPFQASVAFQPVFVAMGESRTRTEAIGSLAAGNATESDDELAHDSVLVDHSWRERCCSPGQQKVVVALAFAAPVSSRFGRGKCISSTPGEHRRMECGASTTDRNAKGRCSLG